MNGLKRFYRISIKLQVNFNAKKDMGMYRKPFLTYTMMLRNFYTCKFVHSASFNNHKYPTT